MPRVQKEVKLPETQTTQSVSGKEMHRCFSKGKAQTSSGHIKMSISVHVEIQMSSALRFCLSDRAELLFGAQRTRNVEENEGKEPSRQC